MYSYCLHLLASSTAQDPQITVKILPVRPSPVQSAPSTPSEPAQPPPHVPSDILLGKVPVSPWDLEWVEGGLILREPGEGGEKGWFCRVERYWWTRKEPVPVTAAPLVGLGLGPAEGGDGEVDMEAEPETTEPALPRTGSSQDESASEADNAQAGADSALTGEVPSKTALVDGEDEQDERSEPAGGERKGPEGEVGRKASAGLETALEPAAEDGRGSAAPEATMSG